MISLYNSFELSFFNIIQSSVVSGRPPLLEIIVAHALEEDSNAVLPNGSSQREGTTAISDLFKNSIKAIVSYSLALPKFKQICFTSPPPKSN